MLLSSVTMLTNLFLFSSTASAAMLYSGGQKVILSPYMSTSCDTAFNTTINCPEKIIQLVTYSVTDVAWNTSSLTSMCTSACTSSLQTLANNVKSGCGTDVFALNGQNMTYTALMDFIQYKYGFICLKDASSGSFCSDVEKGWNITQMVAAGKATWPTNPPRCYLDFTQGHYDPILDINGTCINPFPDDDYNGYTSYTTAVAWTAADYYQNRTAPVLDSNYGWKDPLEYDEYPLEIQCSSCMTQNFKYGFTSKWGSTWDEMTEQIWANMKKNCKLTDTIVPASNLTGRGFNSTWFNPSPAFVPATCPRNISITAANMTCNSVALQYQFGLQALSPLLPPTIDCARLKVGDSFCAPFSCPITVNNVSQSVLPFVNRYSNFTFTQFLTWNPSLSTKLISPGEVVCVGPPGGLYTPTNMAPAQPTVYTTTATPSKPTQTGTIANCGKYYTVVSGDECNKIALKFSITFSDLINMNPSLDSACSNLYAGYDYCVAPVNGTTVTPVTSTKQPASTTSTTSTSTTSGSSTSTSPVVTPTPTQSGMVANCKKFYKAVSGDGCYDIATKYGITLDQFVAWNPAVKSDCSGLYADYNYCVGI